MASSSQGEIRGIPVWRGRFVALAGVVLVALTLRIPVAAVSPIVEMVRQDIALSDTLVGLLGAIPVFAFAVFGAITPLVTRRIGLEGTLVIALVTSVAGEVIRATVSSAPAFLAWTGLALAGMGMGNVLLPPLVKRYFPDRIGVVTAAYSVTISIGAAVPPLVVVALANEVGWRLALGGWAAVAFVAAVPWAIVALRAPGRIDRAERSSVAVTRASGRVSRSPLAWGLALMFGLNSLNFYTMLAWLPSILTDAGLSDQNAALALGVFAMVGIALALAVPPLAARMSNPMPIVWVSTAALVIGYAGFAFAPAAIPVLWAVCAGTGPGVFPLVLVLITMRSSTSEGVVSLSGFVQGLGYLIAALGPLAVGVLHESSGGWGSTYVFLAGTILVMLAASVVGCRPGTIEQSWGASRSGR